MPVEDSSSSKELNRWKEKRIFRRYTIELNSLIEVIRWSNLGKGSILFLVTRRGVLWMAKCNLNDDSSSRGEYFWSVQECFWRSRHNSKALLGTKVLSTLNENILSKGRRIAIVCGGILSSPSLIIVDQNSNEVLLRQIISTIQDNKQQLKVTCLKLLNKESISLYLLSLLQGHKGSINISVERYNAILLIGTKDGKVYCSFLHLDFDRISCDISVALEVLQLDYGEEIISLKRMGEKLFAQGIYGNIHAIGEQKMFKVTNVTKMSFQRKFCTSTCKGPSVRKNFVSFVTTVSGGSSLVIKGKLENVPVAFDTTKLAIREEMATVVSCRCNISTYYAFVTFRGALIISRMKDTFSEGGIDMFIDSNGKLSSSRARYLLNELAQISETPDQTYDESHLSRIRDTFRVAGSLSPDISSYVLANPLKCSFSLSSTTLVVNVSSDSYKQVLQLLSREDDWIYSIHCIQSSPLLEYLDENVVEKFKHNSTVSCKRILKHYGKSIQKLNRFYRGSVFTKQLPCSCLPRGDDVQLRYQLWGFNPVIVSSSLEVRFGENANDKDGHELYSSRRRKMYKCDANVSSIGTEYAVQTVGAYSFDIIGNNFGMIVPIRYTFNHWSLCHSLEEVARSREVNVDDSAEQFVSQLLERDDPLMQVLSPFYVEENALTQHGCNLTRIDSYYISERKLSPNFLPLSFSARANSIFGFLLAVLSTTQSMEVEHQNIEHESSIISLVVAGFYQHHHKISAVLSMLRASFIRHVIQNELQDDEKSTLALTKYCNALTSRSTKVEIRRLELALEKLKELESNGEIVIQLYEKLRQLQFK